MASQSSLVKMAMVTATEAAVAVVVVRGNAKGGNSVGLRSVVSKSARSSTSGSLLV